MYKELLIEEKLGKIQNFAQIILKNTEILSQNNDLFLNSTSKIIANEAYAIKCLVQQISGILKN